MTAIQAVTAAVWNTPPHPREDYDERVVHRAIGAFLDYLDKAGLAIVPREETDEMLNAAIAAEDHGGDGDTWAAKLGAAPKFDPETM